MSVKTKLFITMLLQLGIWGTFFPKLLSYMIALGFTPAEQGAVGFISGAATLFGMFFTNALADRYFAAEKVLATSHFLGAILLLAVSQAETFPVFFATFLIFNIIFVPTFSVSTALALANLKDPAREFGIVRLGGTIGWIVASWPPIFILGEGSTRADMQWIFVIAAAGSVILGLQALTLPHTPPLRTERARPAWRDALATLRNPVIAVLFAVTFIDSVVMAVYFLTADLFLTRGAGVAGNWSMVMLSVAQIAEIGAMFILGRALVRLGWRTTMVIGVLGHTLRFAVFAVFPDSIALIIAAQLLHGICYAFFFATLYIFIDQACPKDVRVSVQGLFNIVIMGLGGMVAAVVIPWIIAALTSVKTTAQGPMETIDFSTLFLATAGVAAAGALLLLLAFRPPNRGPADDKMIDPTAGTDPLPSVSQTHL